MYAMLGEVPFEFLQSFSEWEETHGADYAKHEMLGGRPRLQAVGNDLTKIRFGLKLHWKLGSPDAAYKGLVAAKEAQQALSLVTGAGRFVGWFVIESLSARTLVQDAQGRTAARELEVSLVEFVGDPNNPLPAPAVAPAQENPLLSLLPESVRGTASKAAEAVQKGVRLYRAAEKEIGQIQNLIGRARDLKNDPAAAFSILGDALSVGGSALGKLDALPQAGRYFGSLKGAAEMLSYGGQASRHLADGIAAVRGGVESRSIGGWLDAAAEFAAAAGDSLNNGAAGAESLTAYLAARKDGA